VNEIAAAAICGGSICGTTCQFLVYADVGELSITFIIAAIKVGSTGSSRGLVIAGRGNDAARVNLIVFDEMAWRNVIATSSACNLVINLRPDRESC
jgi:hypothetical protein